MAWGFVRANAPVQDSAITAGVYTVAITAPANGNCLILVAAVMSGAAVGAPAITSITDNGTGNTWVRGKTQTNAGVFTSIEIWYCKNVQGSPTTVTVNVNVTGVTTPEHCSWVAEYSGLDTAAPFDVAAGTENDNTATCPTGTTASTAIAGELALAVYADDNQGVAITPPGGWTSRVNLTSAGHITGFAVAENSVGVGAQTATFTTAAGDFSSAAIATFKPSVAVAPDNSGIFRLQGGFAGPR